MKIAHIVSTFPPHIGGMGEVCYKEAEMLSKKGHYVTVFTLGYTKRDNINDSNLPFKVIRLRSLFRLGDGGVAPQLLWKLRGFDVVHLHYPFYVSAHYVWQAKLLWRFKYIVTYHMDARPEGLFKKCVQGIYDRSKVKFILKMANKVIAIDKDYLKHSRYGRVIKKNKVVEVFNGVDTDVFKEINYDGDQRSKKSILFVGNPIPIKRLDILIQAIKLIPDKDVVLLVVGGGYDLENYKKMVEELELKDRVIFAGSCHDKKQLAKYYNSSICTAIPSVSESFSLVALESMACGCPVIANNIPGICGRIDDGVDGFLVKDDDWLNSLQKMLDLSEEQRKKMGEAGRKKVLSQYSWDDHVKKLEEIYQG